MSSPNADALAARPAALDDGKNPRTFFVKSPEDLALRKLLWYRTGGEVSERQWGDVVGLIKIRGEQLDGEYLRHWAAELHVTDLLEGARSEASE